MNGSQRGRDARGIRSTRSACQAFFDMDTAEWYPFYRLYVLGASDMSPWNLKEPTLMASGALL